MADRKNAPNAVRTATLLRQCSLPGSLLDDAAKRGHSPSSSGQQKFFELLSVIARLPDRSSVDQMVGPCKCRVADCAVTTVSFDSNAGEAMSMGSVACALIDAPASGRMAIGEGADQYCLYRIGNLAI
ncbi:MAG: hypothetical protein ACFHHU_13765 [Porticoccaceae bacterium]